MDFVQGKSKLKYSNCASWPCISAINALKENWRFRNTAATVNKLQRAVCFALAYCDVCNDYRKVGLMNMSTPEKPKLSGGNHNNSDTDTFPGKGLRIVEA